MCWSEIDWDSQVWTCPWQRIKTGKKTKKDHLVPLSDQAMAVLKEIEAMQKEDGIEIGPTGLVFVHPVPSDEKQFNKRIARGGRHMAGRPLGNLAAANFLKRGMGRPDITVHGFRATFSAWANDKGFQREVIEMALGHVVGNQVERIYARGAQRSEPRRLLMEAWADFCDRTEPVGGDNVVQMRSA